MNAPENYKTGPRPTLAAELDHAFGETADSDIPATAFLVGLSGKHAGKLFRVTAGQSLIGRTSKALVTLDERAVSHQHASLVLGSTGCTLTDLGSTNGTFLNDGRLTEPTELHAGDVLRFGNSTLGYLTDAEDEEQHTRALARVTGSSVALSQATGGGSHTTDDIASGNPQSLVVAPAQAAVSAKPKVSALDDSLDKLALALTFLRQYWKLIVATSVLCASAGAATIAIKPPLSKAEFEISLHEEETETTARHFATRGIEYFAEAEKTFFNRELVRQTMLDMKMPTPLDAVKGTARGLEFHKAGMRSYRGSYSHRSPKFAERFLAQHLQNYLEREIGKSIKVLTSEVELLRTQYEENEVLLKEHEASLREFKEKHMSALPVHAMAQVQSRASLLTERDALSASLSRHTQELALAKKQLASEDALETTKVQRSQPYESGLSDIRRQIAGARAQGFAEGHPELKRLLSEEAALQRLRDAAVHSEVTATDRRVNVEHKRLSNRVGELNILVNDAGQQLGQVNSRLTEIGKIAGAMPQVEQQIAGKVREVEASKRLHEKLFEQLKSKELELEFERASVAARYEVLEAPSAYSVNRLKTTAKRGGMGAAGGIVLGILLAALHWLRVYAKSRPRGRDEHEQAAVQNQLVG